MIVGITTAIRIVVLPGDGIGPEVTEAARRVLDVAAGRVGLRLDFVEELVGGASVDAFGVALRPQTMRMCKTLDAIQIRFVGGAQRDVGGPQSPPGTTAGVLALRK